MQYINQLKYIKMYKITNKKSRNVQFLNESEYNNFFKLVGAWGESRYLCKYVNNPKDYECEFIKQKTTIDTVESILYGFMGFTTLILFISVILENLK